MTNRMVGTCVLRHEIDYAFTKESSSSNGLQAVAVYD